MTDVFSRARGRQKWAVVVLFGVLAGLMVWWWSHATVFEGRLGAKPVAAMQKGAGSRAVFVGVGIPDAHGDGDETITFRSTSVDVAENTAGAHASLAVCERAGRTDLVGSVLGTPLQYCSAIRPVVKGTRMRWQEGGQPSEYLVLRVVPTHPGTVAVDGISVSYRRSWSHGWQQGTEKAAVNVRVEGAPAPPR
ncbi:hypothetical protein [Nocardioides jejuensis]|uniref:Uncharacterized protein n=1 Tax=Nocardioides jejuensis TaxID=2502782 RepID=A0A4R1CCU4_9ACTN|nr:hypothetical protein [Nocardioides jejuensis]TCJ28984.1 hypothetical protein EPD65_07425 [Nocardioides jejuensis]